MDKQKNLSGACLLASLAGDGTFFDPESGLLWKWKDIDGLPTWCAKLAVRDPRSKKLMWAEDMHNQGLKAFPDAQRKELNELFILQ